MTKDGSSLGNGGKLFHLAQTEKMNEWVLFFFFLFFLTGGFINSWNGEVQLS